MKKIMIAFIGMFICTNSVFADAVVDCMNRQRSDKYFEENKDKQIGTEKFRSLSPEKQREAKIRNICFGDSIEWHTFCNFSVCLDSKTKKIFGKDIEKFCDLAKIDCFTDDIEKIVSTLQDNDSYVYSLFLPDMNEITDGIANGKAEIAIIDTDNAICYKTDDNGNTVWHVFAKNNKDSYSWQNLCLSYLKNTNLKDYLEAVYKTKNKSGKTAIQEAMVKGNAENLLEVISWYYKQEKLDCNTLAKEISYANSISLDNAKQLIKKCY